jgi:hypothetical protein
MLKLFKPFYFIELPSIYSNFCSQWTTRRFPDQHLVYFAVVIPELVVLLLWFLKLMLQPLLNL